MKTKTTVVIGVALMAIGSAAGPVHAGGLQFSISVGLPRLHVHSGVVVAPPFLHVPPPPVVVCTPPPPVVVCTPPVVVVPAPRVVVYTPPVFHRPPPPVVVVAEPVCRPVAYGPVRYWTPYPYPYRAHYVDHSRAGGHHGWSHDSHGKKSRGR